MNEISQEQLSAYLDNALTPGEREAVERALKNSPALQAEVDKLKRLRSLLKELPAPEPSEGFYQRVLAKVEEPRRPWLWAVPTVAAAAAAMVMIYIAHDSGRSRLFVPEVRPLAEESLPSSDLKSPLSGMAAPSLPTPPRDGSGSRGLKDKGSDAGGAPLEIAAVRQDWSNVKSERMKDPATKTGALENESRDAFGSKGGMPAAELSGPGAHEAPVGTGGMEPRKSLALERVGAKEISGEKPTEWKGVFSSIEDRREVVIRNAMEWDNFWTDLFANRAPATPVPGVDFSRFMVVGILQGSKPSSGYSVTIERLVTGEKDVQILYKETSPDPAMAHLTVMTAPYHLMMVPQSSLPVVFKKVQ